MGCRAHPAYSGVQHHKEQHGPVARRFHRHQLAQMLGTTGGDRIGEVAHASLLPLVEQGDRFYLDVTIALLVIFQQQIDATVLFAILHLGAQPAVTRQRSDSLLLDQLPGDLVGARR